ncbi:hypothetical protein HPB47_010796, partial [Ixodes persulcatus]
YYNLRHPHILVGLQGEESREDCKEERAFMKKEGMLHLLGKGLECRTLKHCYYRGRALFAPSRKVEKRDYSGKRFRRRLTAEEEDKLFELYATLGPQWMEIGRRMDKYAGTVRAAVRNNKLKEKYIGRWSKNEVALLEEAIRGQIGDDLKDISKVCWKKVASHVGTRTDTQCKLRWASSPQYLRKAWRNVVDRVPRHVPPDYKERIKFLYHTFIPILLTKKGSTRTLEDAIMLSKVNTVRPDHKDIRSSGHSN